MSLRLYRAQRRRLQRLAIGERSAEMRQRYRIVLCWMPRGVQFEVETPGKNQKRYVFGGLNAKTGHVVWLASERKNSGEFIQWLELLRRAYRRYRTIHVVCDNYIPQRDTLSRFSSIGSPSCVKQ